MTVCGSCGRDAEDGSTIAAGTGVEAFMCSACWDDFWGEVPVDDSDVCVGERPDVPSMVTVCTEIDRVKRTYEAWELLHTATVESRDEWRERCQAMARKVGDKKAELDNMYPLLTAAEQKNATYAHELDLLRLENDRLTAAFEEARDELHDMKFRAEEFGSAS